MPTLSPSPSERHDAPRDEARDLHDGDRHAGRRLDDDRAALVLLARLVEGGVEERARHVEGAHDAPGDGRAVDVHVEYGEEDRDAPALGVADAELGGRAELLDRRDAPVARSDDQAVAQRRHAIGIAEEIDDPERDDGCDPAQRRPDEKQQKGHGEADGDELVAVAVHGRQAVGYRVEKAVTIGQGSAS